LILLNFRRKISDDIDEDDDEKKKGAVVVNEIAEVVIEQPNKRAPLAQPISTAANNNKNKNDNIMDLLDMHESDTTPEIKEQTNILELMEGNKQKVLESQKNNNTNVFAGGDLFGTNDMTGQQQNLQISTVVPLEVKRKMISFN